MDFFAAPALAIPFAGNNLDRADNRRNDAVWLTDLRAAPHSRFLACVNLQPVLGGQPLLRPVWLRAGQLPAASLDEAVFLGLDAGAGRFAVNIAAGSGWQPPAGTAPQNLRQILVHLDIATLAPLGQACALLAWHARRPYCSACGAPTRMARAGYMRACTSAACGAQHFPRTDPVVIMLAVRDDFCLLGRQPGFPPAMYSALAGFMEPGESIEDAVRRETREEADIRIGRVRYVASQPWPFPSSLMIGCLAEALSETIRIDGNELEDARWLSRTEARRARDGDGAASVGVPPPVSMAYHLLSYWLDGR